MNSPHRILFLTQYFPPETGAPQNRLFELALRLHKSGWTVDVLTAMPNYPLMKVHEGYRGKWFASETRDGIRVFRAWIYVSSTGKIVPRLLNYFSFVFTSFLRGICLRGRYDVVFCESPPLFLGMSAVLLAKVLRAKLVFNVSDLWPESAERLGLVTNKTMLHAAYRLEAWCYKRSALVTGQTQGIVRDINARFPAMRTYWLPNGVDLELYNPSKFDGSVWRVEMGHTPDEVLLLYAGIVGHAQGLEVILEAAVAMRHQPNIRFLILGEGPEKARLIEMKKARSLNNVVFLDAVPKEKMGAILAAADAAIVPLRKLELFQGAIPSKIFETLAMKKPIFLGVDGEARELFIEQGQAGWYFEPENHADLASKISAVVSDKEAMNKAGERGREYVDKNFNRNNIARSFIEELNRL